MPKHRIAYSHEAADQIVAFLRSRGFPGVAAEAAMIPVEVYQEWIGRGESKKSREPYRAFALRIRQAIAHARLTAEIDAKDKGPRFWLLPDRVGRRNTEGAERRKRGLSLPRWPKREHRTVTLPDF